MEPFLERPELIPWLTSGSLLMRISFVSMKAPKAYWGSFI